MPVPKSTFPSKICLILEINMVNSFFLLGLLNAKELHKIQKLATFYLKNFDTGNLLQFLSQLILFFSYRI